MRVTTTMFYTACVVMLYATIVAAADPAPAEQAVEQAVEATSIHPSLENWTIPEDYKDILAAIEAAQLGKDPDVEEYNNNRPPEVAREAVEAAHFAAMAAAKAAPKPAAQGGEGRPAEVFEPTDEWQVVEDHHQIPAGCCEIRMDMSNGGKWARNLQAEDQDGARQGQGQGSPSVGTLVKVKDVQKSDTKQAAARRNIATDLVPQAKGVPTAIATVMRNQLREIGHPDLSQERGEKVLLNLEDIVRSFPHAHDLISLNGHLVMIELLKPAVAEYSTAADGTCPDLDTHGARPWLYSHVLSAIAVAASKKPKVQAAFFGAVNDTVLPLLNGLADAHASGCSAGKADKGDGVGAAAARLALTNKVLYALASLAWRSRYTQSLLFADPSPPSHHSGQRTARDNMAALMTLLETKSLPNLARQRVLMLIADCIDGTFDENDAANVGSTSMSAGGQDTTVHSSVPSAEDTAVIIATSIVKNRGRLCSGLTGFLAELTVPIQALSEDVDYNALEFTLGASSTLSKNQLSCAESGLAEGLQSLGSALQHRYDTQKGTANADVDELENLVAMIEQLKDAVKIESESRA